MTTAPLMTSYGASWRARTPPKALPEVTPLPGTGPRHAGNGRRK